MAEDLSVDLFPQAAHDQEIAGLDENACVEVHIVPNIPILHLNPATLQDIQLPDPGCLDDVDPAINDGQDAPQV
jgi:hypothetical protein